MLRENIIPFDGRFIIKEERLDFGGMISKDNLSNIKTASLLFLEVAGLFCQYLTCEILLLSHLQN
jgi:hypothetical protein